eukprot:363148-Chlamydomonas_euryale.AAC.4
MLCGIGPFGPGPSAQWKQPLMEGYTLDELRSFLERDGPPPARLQRKDIFDYVLKHHMNSDQLRVEVGGGYPGGFDAMDAWIREAAAWLRPIVNRGELETILNEERQAYARSRVKSFKMMLLEEIDRVP